MKSKLLLLLIFWSSVAHATNFYTFNGGGTKGDWTNPFTWTTDPTGSIYLNAGGIQVPGTGDNVTITNGYTVTLDADVTTTALKITVQQGGTLDLGGTYGFTNTLAQLDGQGTLRVGRSYFPAITTNNFDDAGTGTVEYYDWVANGQLPQPASNQYNNLRVLNTTGTPYVVRFDSPALVGNGTIVTATPTINGNLTLTRTGTAGVSFNFGAAAMAAYAGRSLIVNGDILVGAGTTLGVTAVAGIHNLTANADFINNGTVSLYNSDTQLVKLLSGGAADADFACNGPTNLALWKIDKGTNSSTTLNVTSTPSGTGDGNLHLNFAGQFDPASATANPIYLLDITTNGVVKLGENIVLPRVSNVVGTTTVSSNYNVGRSNTSPTLWIAGAKVYNNATNGPSTMNNALVVYGTFRITAGEFESKGLEGAVIREDGRYQIEGGKVTVTKFRPSNTTLTQRGSFAMSGGEFIANGTTSDNVYARFSIPFPNQSFEMSGGIIRVSNPETATATDAATGGGFHIGVLPANASVTGGTIELNCPTSNLNFRVLSTAPLWDVVVAKPGSGAGGTSVVQLNNIGFATYSASHAYANGTTYAAQPLVVQHSLTLQPNALLTSGTVPTLDANGQAVTLQGDFTVNANTSYLATTNGGNTTFFTGGENQLFINNNATALSLNNLTVNKTAGTVQLSGSTTAFTVTGALNLLNGVFFDGGKTLNVQGNITNSATHTSAGGNGSITLTGTNTISLGGNGLGVFGNLTINNTPVSNVAATLTAAQSVAGILTLASNKRLNIDVYKLSLTDVGTNTLVAGAGGFSTSRMIQTSGKQSDGGLSKTFGTTGTGFLYAVGVNGKYTPATIALTKVPQSYGQVSVSPANVQEPFVTNPNALNYYWKVRSTGFGAIKANGISLSFVDVNTDVVGGAPSQSNPANYVPGRYQPATAIWNTTAGLTADVVENTPASNLTINFPEVSYLDGEYTAGVPAAFSLVKAYYSLSDGNWETPATWSNTSHTGPAATTAPGANNPVFVGGPGQPHFVKVTADNARSGSLVIADGATLDLQTTIGHNFGALPDAVAGGEGTLRISAPTGAALAEFPKGDFGTFVGPLGGTVEYYVTGAQDFAVPVASASGLSLRTYRNLIMNAPLGQVVDLPNANLRVYNTFRMGTPDPNGAVAFNGIVRLDASATITNTLTVDGLLSVENGVLYYDPANGTTRDIIANGDVQIASGATLTTNAGTTSRLLVAGNLTNNGTLDLNTLSAATVGLTFTGTANKSLTGTNGAASTRLSKLTVNKGSSLSPVLTLDVAGTLITPTYNWLTLTNGTLRYAKGAVLNVHADPAATAAYSIPETAGLTVDGTNAVVNIATDPSVTSTLADLQLAGQLRILKGTLNVGQPANGAGNDIEYASAGNPRIEVTTGGQLNVNGKIRRGLFTSLGALRYEQSGGRVDIYGKQSAANQGRGSLEVLSDESSFRMSGGELALHGTDGATVGDLYLHPDSVAVSGGTVILGSAEPASSFSIGIDATAPLFNLRVEPSLNSFSNTGIIRFSPLTLLGSLQIGGPLATPNALSVFNANSQSLAIGQNLLNYNNSTSTSPTGGGYRSGVVTQTTTFNGIGNVQTIQGYAGNLTSFGNLTLNNTGGSLKLDGNSDPAVSTVKRDIYVGRTLTLTKGTLNDNGQNITVVGRVANSATHLSVGTGQIILAGGVNQPLSGDGTGKFGNLRLNNSAGATATADQEVTGNLILASGVLDIGSRLLTIGSAGTVTTSPANTFSAAKLIRTNGLVADQGLRKVYPAGTGSDFTFPIGVVNKYTPVRFNVTANGAAAGAVTVRPINMAHPSTTALDKNELAYYWKVNSTGFSSPTVTQVYNYLDSDVQTQSTTEANYVTGRFVDNAWTPAGGIAGTVNAGANTMTLTGVNYFDGDYTAGAPAEFLAVPILYSRNATAGTPGGANWDDPNSWTTDPTGAGAPAADFPTQANPTSILAGHLIRSNGSGRGTAQLILNGTLDLESYTSNNFNTVSGNGTLKIGSAVFPAGNYNQFTAATGGTVDYTAAVLLPARDTYNNLLLSGGTAKTLSSLDLTVNGELQVGAGTSVTNANSQSVTLTSATKGLLVNGSLVLNDGSLTVASNLVNNGSLSLGDGTVSIGLPLSSPATSVTNTGTIMGGSGSFTIGKSLTNSGSFTAGTGSVTVPGTFTNTGTYTAATNLLTVSGNFTNASGSFIAGSSQLDLYGNFTNSGTFTTAGGTSLVRLLGSGARTLTGTTTFYDLEKLTTGGDLTLGLATDLTVTDILTLNGGKLITGTTNTVYLTNAASESPLLGTSSTVYVQGRLAITFPSTANAAREFPVGNGGFYRPVNVRQMSTSSSPQILVEMINYRPVGTVDAPLTNLSHLRYYRIQLLSGGITDPMIQLPFNNNGQVDEPAFVPGNLRIAKKNTGDPNTAPSGLWMNAAGSGAYSPGAPAGIVTSGSTPYTSIDGDSFFALASTNVTDNPLPVELTKFTATASGPAVQVAWTTASEKNSDYFEVQRSANGLTFDALTKVAAHGNSGQLNDYSHRDARPLTGTSYYRLRLVDQDGSFSYSPVAVVHFSATSAAAVAAVSLYPNPGKGESFHLSALNVPAGAATVRVLDLQGRLISQHAVDFTQSDVTVTPAQKLPAGTYLVTVQTTAGRFTQRLVVE